MTVQQMRRGLLLAWLALASFLASCSGESSTAMPVENPDELGAYAVGHTTFTVVDAARDGRELVVDVWYPVDEADAATEPVTRYLLGGFLSLPSDLAVDDLPVSSADGPRAFLVFSHGFGGINTQSTPLMETLASHGFIVASPEHTGNTAVDVSDPTPAENRVPDVSLLIDEMFERSKTSGDAFEGRIDESKVGVLGHSFGGSTALGTVAGWAGADPDPRVKAIGIIAGGVGANNFSEQVLATVTEPTILLVGTLDPGALENHNYVFDRMPNAGALFKVEIIGANHTHFADVCGIGDFLLNDLMLSQDAWPPAAGPLIPLYNATCSDEVFPIAEAQRLQNLYMVAHFKRFLLGQTGYDRFLSAVHAEANEPAVTFVAQ